MIKYLLKLAYRYILPDFIKSRIQSRHDERFLNECKERMKRTRVSKEEIASVISKLDIDGCDVMLHTSMISIGKLEGGRKWVAECLFDKMDLERNTLLTVALTYIGKNKDFLESNPTFDVRTAPIAMGAINEYIASLDGAIRSIHPTHSVVAIGKKAKEYTMNHHKDVTPFGENSPYYKIIKNRGKIVFFGISINSFTAVHALEDPLLDVMPVNIYNKKRYSVRCLDWDGKELYVETPCHNPIAGMRRSLIQFENEMILLGIMKKYPIGEGFVSVVDAYSFAQYYLSKLKEGYSMYGKIKVTEKLKKAIEELQLHLS